MCSHYCNVECTYIGTLIAVKQKCPHCQFHREWRSQPMVNNIPAGNILLSASIFFNGASFVKMNQVLNSLQMQTVSVRTHYNHMTSYLQPTIFSFWKDQQSGMLQNHHAQGGQLALGGDMRAATPGHCAKYGSYTMMELDANRIVDIQLVQVSIEG